MNKIYKFFLFLALCLIVIIGFGVPKCFCESSIDDLRKAAEQGDAEAQFNLGVAYFNGTGVPKDDAEAVKWCRKAAEQGLAVALNNLGAAYTHGIGVPKNDTEAVKWYRKATEQGLAEAQFNLGAAYANGTGVPNDNVEAVKWYRKAAEQGLAVAQFNLGVAYTYGTGVIRDNTEAVNWYRKAAGQGYAQAQFNLGVAYTHGAGVPKDDTEAVKWYRKAAEQGLAVAQFNLGAAYANGTGVPNDDVEAVKWYRKAAEQGNANAQNDLARFLEKIESARQTRAKAETDSRKRLKAAEQGDADAQYQLGWAYTSGEGAPKDEVEGVKWYRKAAEQGHIGSQKKLGAFYASGRVVPKNAALSVYWFRKAAEQGDADAQYQLALSYDLGDGVLKDEIEALAWYNIAAASGNQEAKKFRTSSENQLGKQASLFAQKRSKEILKEIESSKQTKTKKEATAQTQSKKPAENAGPKGSGTGAFVTDDGLILTAAHVVGKSASLKVVTKQGLKVARVVKVDAANDLALLKCEGSFQAAPVKSSSGMKLGQSVFTIGFPNIEFQGFSPKMTKGEISSLSGLRDDPRHWQISAPVQPGNSGGPLFDEAGNVIGFVLSKLDAMKVAKFTGDMPQNVNYAVKSIYALPLLEPYSDSLAPEIGASASLKMLENIVEKVQGAVVLILVY